jgi:hypothetical protein
MNNTTRKIKKMKGGERTGEDIEELIKRSNIDSQYETAEEKKYRIKFFEDREKDLTELKSKYDILFKIDQAFDIEKKKAENIIKKAIDDDGIKYTPIEKDRDIRRVFDAKKDNYLKDLQKTNQSNYDFYRRQYNTYKTKLESLYARISNHIDELKSKNKTSKKRENNRPFRTGNASNVIQSIPPFLSNTPSQLPASSSPNNKPDGELGKNATEEYSDSSGTSIPTVLSRESLVSDTPPEVSEKISEVASPFSSPFSSPLSSPVSSQVSSIARSLIEKSPYSNTYTPGTSPAETPRDIGRPDTPAQTFSDSHESVPSSNSPIEKGKLDKEETPILQPSATYTDNKFESKPVISGDTQIVYPIFEQGKTTIPLSGIDSSNSDNSATVNYNDNDTKSNESKNIDNPNTKQEEPDKAEQSVLDRVKAEAVERQSLQNEENIQKRTENTINLQQLVQDTSSESLGNAVKGINNASISGFVDSTIKSAINNSSKICIYKSTFRIENDNLTIKENPIPIKLNEIDNMSESYSPDYSNQTECILLEAFIGMKRDPIDNTTIESNETLKLHKDKFNKLYFKPPSL